MATNLASKATARPAVKPRIDWLRIGVHAIGLAGLIQLGYFWLADRLTVNPIQFIEQHLGRMALYLLLITLGVTPIVTITGWKALPKHRRTFGLYTFVYFFLHFLTFAALDYGLNLGEILRLTSEKPFIWVGLTAGLILLALAVTSFKYWMKLLGKNWKRLHKTVYLAGGLVILHYAWALKGSLSTLSGDIMRPLMMGLLLTILLILRIPAVRKLVSRRRYRRITR
jgi:sulfoxide reductase heme-binding subunit YedZ